MAIKITKTTRAVSAPLRHLSYAVLCVFGILALAVGVVYFILLRSLPPLDGQVPLAGLSVPVSVATDAHGVPAITADNRLDALRALGYVVARDRLFQIELMRRKNGGRLAEIVGEVAVKSDIRARTYGFHRLAKRILTKLPEEHRHCLEAYAEGVNAFIEKANVLPFEFSILDFRPEPWKAEDSILLVLGMYDMLTSGAEREERMLTVMEKSLPAEVVAFLTPDTDPYTDSLLSHGESLRPVQRIPLSALQKTLALHRADDLKLAKAVEVRDFVVGSNAWAVAANKTSDGRAILANDMHIGLSIPNIWYRSELRYGAVHVAGVTLPGTPLFIAGSNNHVAWGTTSLLGDFLDLVSLDINPGNHDEYRLSNQWQAFQHFTETILVKGSEARQVDIRSTVWGPVSAQPLLDKPVALHWTALDDESVNIALIDLAQAETLEAAVNIVNDTGGPQLNILLADASGDIAWTIMGKIPKRHGIDGSVSRSWADGSVGWDGYVDARHMPRLISPNDGILVSANNRRLGREFPYVIGHQFVNGYRAYRIDQRLRQMRQVNEWSMFQLQLDTEIEFYDFYHRLALDVLSLSAIDQHPELLELREYLLAWNGRADADSLGFALLQKFRALLAEKVFAPFLAASKHMDADFEYSWTYLDTPLQAMLTERPPQLLPEPLYYQNWNGFLVAQLEEGYRQLRTEFPAEKLSGITWGKLNKVRFSHPVFGPIPILGQLFAMPPDEMGGCGGCVRAAGSSFGASERMVVSPNHLDEAFLHMPGGQSAHPLSPYYSDEQSHWVKGFPLRFLAGKPEHRMILKPNAN